MSAPEEAGDRAIEEEITLQAPPQAVTAAWLDPDELAAWFVDRAAGTGEPGTEMTWAWDAYELEQTVSVVEAKAGERVVLEVAWGATGTPTLIEVQVDPMAGGARLRLVHSGFLEGDDWEGEYQGAKSGWTNALATLKHYLEHHRGRSKETLDLFEPARYELDSVLTATRTREGLSRWLGTPAQPIEARGQPVAIELLDGSTLTGHVLALTGWETLLSWQEAGGVLTFQAFPGEGDLQQGTRMLGLRLATWHGHKAAQARRSLLDASLERLLQIVSP